MKTTIFENKYLEQIVSIWNNAVANETIYKPFTNESFTKKFMENPLYDNDGFIVMLENEKVVGFGHAIVNNEQSHPGYITCVVVDKPYQRQGYGSQILKLLEQYLQSRGKKLLRLLFFNPINLEWIVPNTNAEHPNAPAIPFNSPFYFLLLANGYNTDSQQDAFYVDITNYELPQKVVDKDNENAKKGYHITIYDEKKHYGFKELFEALDNQGWYQLVQKNLNQPQPKPTLIIEKEGEILGWTGPLYAQPSGRGYLDGIGVHPKTQGMGLGKSLFCHLVHESKLRDAKYMTFFTGSTNPARNIYLYAGFKIVQSFASLRKELRK